MLIHYCNKYYFSFKRQIHTGATKTYHYANETECITFLCNFNGIQRQCFHKLINICMFHGNKTKSYSIITNTLKQLSIYDDAIVFIMTSINNVKPILEVRKMRISGSTQLVPSIVPIHRQNTLAIRWISEAAVKRRTANPNFSLDHCLFIELLDAFNKVGAVRKKRDELHKLAENNRGFSHYRWW